MGRPGMDVSSCAWVTTPAFSIDTYVKVKSGLSEVERGGRLPVSGAQVLPGSGPDADGDVVRSGPEVFVDCRPECLG